VELGHELPRTATGKVQRWLLEAELGQRFKSLRRRGKKAEEPAAQPEAEEAAAEAVVEEAAEAAAVEEPVVEVVEEAVTEAEEPAVEAEDVEDAEAVEE